jgi:hypothetical protein
LVGGLVVDVGGSAANTAGGLGSDDDVDVDVDVLISMGAMLATKWNIMPMPEL